MNASAAGNASPAITSARRPAPAVPAVDTFTVEAKPLLSKAALKSKKNDALRMLFVGELLPRLLNLGGPGLSSQLRGVSDCREAIDCLSDEVKKELALPVLPDELNMETLMKHLQPVLTQPITTPLGSCSKAWTLNEVGFTALAASPLTSERTLLKLIRPDCTNADLLGATIENEGASEAVLSKVFDVVMRGQQRGLNIRETTNLFEKLSRQPNTPGAVLSAILSAHMVDDDELVNEIFGNIGRHPNTNKETLLVRLATPIFERYSGEKKKDDRWISFETGAAASENVEKYDLVPLMLSKTPYGLRKKLAGNENVSLEHLQKLATHDGLSIRVAVACNPKTDAVTFAELTSGMGPNKLVFSDDDCERFGSADKLAYGFKKLGRGCIDDMFSVDGGLAHRHVLARNSTNPETISNLVGIDDGALDEHIGRNHCTPPAVLERLSSSTEVDVRMAVALNAQTPTKTLSALSEDEQRSVRWMVAVNESTTADILERMLHVSDPKNDTEEASIKYFILNHENMPKHTALVDIRNSAEKGNFDSGNIHQWRNSLPADILSAASQNHDRDVRHCVADNCRLPVIDLARLCKDDSVTTEETPYGGTMNNPLVQAIVDRLSRCLSSDGIAYF